MNKTFRITQTICYTSNYARNCVLQVFNKEERMFNKEERMYMSIGMHVTNDFSNSDGKSAMLDQYHDIDTLDWKD